MRSRVRRQQPVSMPPASSALDSFLADPAKSERIPGAKREKPKTALHTAMLSAEMRAKSGEWDDAEQRTLVGLYAVCHRNVYGVIPVELENPAEFSMASRAAATILHTRFDDDVPATAIFIRWLWKREKERVEWARTQKRDRNRMGWRMQFSDRAVGDFLVARAAHKGA